MSDEGRCLMHGVCQRPNSNNKNSICVSNAKPKSLSAEGVEDLKIWCSHLLPEDYKHGDDVETCCDANQVRALVENYKMASGLLQRCAPCSHNLARHICDMICSPRHSEFIEIINQTDKYVNEIDFYITEEYLNKTFESCKNVIYPAKGQPAVELMGCEDASKCSALEWFSYMGNIKTHSSVPFQINYRALNSASTKVNGKEKNPLDLNVFSCNQSIKIMNVSFIKNLCNKIFMFFVLKFLTEFRTSLLMR